MPISAARVPPIGTPDIIRVETTERCRGPTYSAASAFALQKFGENYLSRLVDFMDSDKMAPQVQAYLFELGTAVAAPLIPRLLEPDEGIRRHVAEVLGGIGDESTVAGLTPLLKDKDKSVQKAARLAIERIKTR